MTPERLRLLDQAASEMIDAVDGGSWAPADPIVLGLGSAIPQIRLDGPSNVVSGDVVTLRGQKTFALNDRGGLVIGNNATATWPVFETARSWDILVPFIAFTETKVGTNPPAYVLDARFLAPKTRFQTPHLLTVPLPPRAIRKGARIAQVAFRYIVSQRPTALPTTAPKFRIVKVVNGTQQTLHTASGDYDANGWLSHPIGATVTDYWFFGLAKQVTYTPDQNHTGIQLTETEWLLQITDEAGGPGAGGLIYLNAVITIDQIADFTID